MSIKLNLSMSVISLSAVLAAGTVFAVSPHDQEIIDRIKPVGEVCIEGDSACAAPAASAAAGPRSGEAVFAAACTACHTAGIAGAPKIGVAADWAPRIAQGEDVLLNNALNGIRGMPPKGTCMNCSDEEIKLAVEHMVSLSQ